MPFLHQLLTSVSISTRQIHMCLTHYAISHPSHCTSFLLLLLPELVVLNLQANYKKRKCSGNLCEKAERLKLRRDGRNTENLGIYTCVHPKPSGLKEALAIFETWRVVNIVFMILSIFIHSPLLTAICACVTNCKMLDINA